MITSKLTKATRKKPSTNAWVRFTIAHQAYQPPPGGNGRRQRQPEAGFTLIELMVVMLIIAILITIALPTFLGAYRAQDRAAQAKPAQRAGGG